MFYDSLLTHDCILDREVYMKVFVISHTHWDREWYLTREKSRFMLIELVDRLLRLLAKQPNYVFMLDGQTIVLEDYLEIKPEKEEEISALIKAGRLRIGPWYVLTDEFLISGEFHDDSRCFETVLAIVTFP